MLTAIAGNTYYLPGAVNIGIYVPEPGRCIVIDTGGDDSSAKLIRKALAEQGLALSQIINTHSHADHIGGNSRLVRETGAAVCAPELECAIVEYPYLEPYYLYSAAPLKELQSKFLLAKPSPVSRVIRDGDNIDGLAVVDLAGHAPGMIGVATPDGVLFTADAYFAEEILAKYFVPFFADVARARATLDRLETAEYAYYLPSHGTLTRSIKGVLAANRERLDRIAAYLRGKLDVPRTKEELLAGLVSDFAIALNPSQYYLVAASLSAHLSCLANAGEAGFDFQAGRMVWSSKSGNI